MQWPSITFGPINLWSMPRMSDEESKPLYEKIIYENEAKGYQLRIVVNEFRGVHYLHIRKYFMSYDEGYLASREGVSMVAELDNIFSLLDGLMEICSFEESSFLVAKHFSDKISALDLERKTVV